MLKIQDGCVNFCSYCIIPYTRGRLRSLPIEAAVEETKKLHDQGYKEIVLTGIEVASYGFDLPGKPNLADIICAVAQAAPGMRIRLGSLEPTVITEDFCRRLAETGRMCRHFHLSLQSGCDKTLKAMNRKYDTARFYQSVELLRRYFPGCALTSDLITGFPGETEEDHQETLAFIRKCSFEDMHIFPYSRRPGTPADKMPDQCQNAVKSHRAHEAQQVANEMHSAFLRSNIGNTLPVLFETEEDGLWTGHSDSYVLVSAAGEALRGTVRQVLITESRGEVLFGNLAD
jgi:threonylcarbamoyladenosine tRNA methylthiotransferase MtaB